MMDEDEGDEETGVWTLQPGMTAFPEAANIFVADQPWLAEYLLPLLSIDLGVLKPDLAGTVVHLVNPIEPYEGCIGQGTEHFHNRFTGANWFALELTADNRYRFLGDEGYFRLSPKRDFELEPEDLPHAVEMRDSYAKARDYFRQHGRLAAYFDSGMPQEQAYLDHLGGEIWGGNWVDTEPIPEAFDIVDDWEQEKVTITRDGKPFFLVGDVAGYNWCAAGADSILLFYEPESRTALFTFDWT